MVEVQTFKLDVLVGDRKEEEGAYESTRVFGAARSSEKEPSKSYRCEY